MVKSSLVIFGTLASLHLQAESNLRQRLCQLPASEELHPGPLWQEDWFCAQSRFEHVRISKNSDVDRRDGERGRSVYACPDSSTWIVSYPAPQPLERISQEKYHFPKSQLDRFCQNVLLQYAPARSGPARRLPLLFEDNTLVLDFSKEPSGTASLTCIPPNAGPELWFLIPIKLNPPYDFPGRDLLSKGAELPQWIAAVRHENHLSALQPSLVLQRSAAAMAGISSMKHDLREFSRQKKNLRQQGLRLIGEDRVAASTREGMGWLLWFSPVHRNLLLNSRATQLAVHLNDEKKFATLLLAQRVH